MKMLPFVIFVSLTVSASAQRLDRDNLLQYRDAKGAIRPVKTAADCQHQPAPAAWTRAALSQRIWNAPRWAVSGLARIQTAMVAMILLRQLAHAA